MRNLVVSSGGFLAFMMIAGLVPLNTPASAHDSWDAPGLRVEPAFDAFRTFDVMEIRIEGRMWSNRTGNLTLEGHTAWLNVTLFDVNHNVIVQQRDVLMWLGNATVEVRVEPIWTSTILNVSVYDFANGFSAFSRVRTEMSMDYVLALEDARRARDRADLQASYDAKFGTAFAWMAAASVSLTFTAMLIFLRVDYKRSVLAGVESYWERFTSRVWPWSFIPEDPLWLDPEAAENYDKGAARFFVWSRQQGQHRRWKDLKDEVDKAYAELDPPPPILPPSEETVIA